VSWGFMEVFDSLRRVFFVLPLSSLPSSPPVFYGLSARANGRLHYFDPGLSRHADGSGFWPLNTGRATAIGRRVLLSAPTSEDVLPEGRGKEHLKALVGRVAKAKSKLLPSGVVIVDGHNFEAVSEGMPIEVGQEVRIVQVRGKRLVVPADRIGRTLRYRQRPHAPPIDAILEDPFN